MRYIKYIAYYAIIIGTFVIMFWFYLIIVSSFNESQSEIVMHIISEFLMSAFCIYGGVMLLKKERTAFVFINIGFAMIIYSCINAAGYYINLENWTMVLLLAGVFASTFTGFILSAMMSYNILKSNNIIML